MALITYPYAELIGDDLAPDLTPAEKIMAHPSFQFMWLPYDDFSTLDAATRVSSLASTRGAIAAAQATAGKRPLLSGNQINGRPCLDFDSTRQDLLVGSTTVDTSGDFSMVAAFRPRSLYDTQVVLNRIYAGVGTDMLGINYTVSAGVGYVNIRCGSASSFTAVPINQWYVVVLSKSGTTLKGRINGVPIAPLSFTGAPAVITPALGGISASGTTWSFEGDIALAAAMTSAVLDTGNADLLAAIQDYCRAALDLAA